MVALCCPTTTSETCVDWIHFETPQAQFDQAALVVIGKPVRVDGETLIYGYRANVYVLEVETVLKGDSVQHRSASHPRQ